jgi:hypothetical protein
LLLSKCEKKGAMLMRGIPNPGARTFTVGQGEGATHGTRTKGGNMKRHLALVALALCMSAPSFGADVVGHSAKTAGKETYKAAKVSAQDTSKAGKAVVKFLF